MSWQRSIGVTYPPQLRGQAAQSINDSITLRALGNGVLGEGQGHHGDDHHLGSVGLGGRHSYLTACIDVDPAVCVASNGTAHCVGDANAQSTPLLGIMQSLHSTQVALLHCKSQV